jgi:two-component system, LytTR family, sensor histidine kinase AlgZ
MHPLLARTSRLSIYVLAWVPISILVAYLVRSSGHLTWFAALAVTLPLCVVYEFMCLSAWYSCKSAPLERTDPFRLALTHLTAAALISFLWMELARLLASGLSRFSAFSDLATRYPMIQPVLLAAGFLLYLLAVAYYYVLLSLEASREAETKVMETSILARDAELKALKAQVNPHFLYNSLNSISALTSIDPAKAQEMCILLADFLRMTLGLGEKASITLGEEVQLLDHFLAIEKIRFGDRLQMQEDIQEESRAAQIPPLLLQPLVENAVGHGIANLLEGGSVSITTRCAENRLTVQVENSCDIDATHSRRGGRGLANVRRRLEARYGKDADMRVSADEGIFKVYLSLPLDLAPVSVAEVITAPHHAEQQLTMPQSREEHPAQ